MRSPIIYGFILIAACALCGSVFAQGMPSTLPDYGNNSLGISATPGTYGGAPAGFWNPAAWAAMREMELAFAWNDRNIMRHRMDNWGLFAGGEGIGFAVRQNSYRYADSLSGNKAYRINDYQLALGGGDPDDYWGLAYNWSKGDSRGLRRDNYLTLGNISRPFKFLSIGNAGSLGLRKGDYRGISDIGIRPFQCHRLTLFADAAYGKRDNPTTLQWGAGLEIQPFDGIRLAAKMSKPYAESQDKLYSVSFGLTINGLGGHVTPHYDKDSELLSTDYMIRLGDQAPFLRAPRLNKDKPQVVTVPMKGELGYRKARWFDRDRVALLDMIEMIENAKNDPQVDGLALNLSGFESSRELMWEVRQKLGELKSAGKKVYIYVDRAGLNTYYFSTVADYLWMDPAGQIMLPGYVAGRTFMKDFLTKIGLGSEEWRYFTYKSAFESLSRRDMSEADREQRRVMIADFFAEWQNTVSEARGISPDTLRQAVDSIVIFLPEAAQAAGLVDTVGTWDDAKDFIENLTGKEPDFKKTDDIESDFFADQSWGIPPKIAIVYAIGECDMDKGIRGRYTSRALRKLAKDEHVKGVVLRADSPGGDALPSDLVARQMKEVSNKKPMIVSQGNVAGSGGYWISMNGDRIFTSPLTLTGSIGVIGGWVWNEKFSDKTGFTYDHVQIGEHADLGAGVTLPLLGAVIPNRNLSDDEKQRVETLIKSFYKSFTKKVAEGRELDEAYVDSIGQGRIWSGNRAIALKLADEIGGLDQALRYARKQANLPESGRGVEIVEYPPRSWVDPGNFMSSSALATAIWNKFGLEPMTRKSSTADYELSFYRRMLASPGSPIFMVDPADLPADDWK